MSLLLTILLAAALVIVLAAFGLCMANLALYRPPPELDAEGAAGRAEAAGVDGNEVGISVCVPARNEAANIEPCVRSLLRQRHRSIEVLLYDDQSADATPAIIERLAAEDARVRRVETVPLPEGWNGKQWGCDRMGRAARGPWLLFTDADVRFEPECLARTLAELRRCDSASRAAAPAEGAGDRPVSAGGQLPADSGADAAARAPRSVALLSTFPRQVTGSIGEALVVPLIHFILLSYLPLARMRRTIDPATSAGCGQFLFVRRDAWERAGGHAAFRSSMHDGIMLPRAIRRAGFHSDLFDGTDLSSVRMYRGFRQTWRGFSKNAFEGLGSLGLLIVVTALHVVGHLFPWAFLVWAASAREATTAQWILGGTAAAVPLVQRQILAARFRQSRVAALVHPLGIALMTAIQWWSWWLDRTGRRAWKGRTTGPAGADRERKAIAEADPS
ncbi:MAG TPA: glycosyltransferase family 2 protein [Phycisphaerales bacterium]|nr:glycosyltransferase family 2 protein [Phycisphaerales bacterium]HMP38621.1 glycosyltransferase family 2 protein [Phycisphaerales bacterium]